MTAIDGATAREKAFKQWWYLTCHAGQIWRSGEAMAREAYYAAWGGSNAKHEAEKAALVEALREIATMPLSKDLDKDKFGELSGRAYGPGWAAWHFQERARTAISRASATVGGGE